ncbi:TLC domain-containing protein At5g14285-like [Selaginella moellendorffii]|uniref:TLC domain-containing protein At5g14285-like n=1 Tax=Selaginella moellendorffii TaxID=88036 RepID=UPI000D1C8183|nr:TLC domain-containing protein At5g14285-like [Selaginella moellendorffii]|eukprot:XP_024543881.1 TLC domain-containing protein At5g14285-like [Selaginella moellendorffii]
MAILDLWSPVLLYSVVLFAAIYGISYQTLFRKWRGIKRYEAASCAVSIIHGTTITALAGYNAWQSPWDLAAPNSATQNKILEYSTAYFLVDLAHYLLVAPGDYLFILHHIATSSYMISCRYFVGHGALSAMAMVAVGEATSPFQNIWTICRMGRDISPAMKTVYERLSPFFTVIFTVFRVGLGPVLVFRISKFYLSGAADGVIPRLLVRCWMAKSALALVGSLVWVYKLWAGLIKFYASKKPGTKIRRAAKSFEVERKKQLLNDEAVKEN